MFRGMLCAVVMLGGCGGPGTIKLEDQDRFGAVRSAAWVEFKQTKSDGTNDQWHLLWMSDQPGLCRKLKVAMVEVGAAYDATLGEVGANADALTQCEGYVGYWEGLAAGVEPLFEKGMRSLVIEPHVPGRERGSAPEERTHTVGYDDVDPYFYGTMWYADENPYTPVTEELDCADYDWQLTPDRVLPEFLEVYSMAEGTMTVENKGDSKKKANVTEGILIAPDGDNAGGIEADATFSYCEVVFNGEAPFFVEAPPYASDELVTEDST